MSVGQPAAAKKQTRTPRGSVGKALQEKRRRQNMLGAVELCDNVMQVEASSAEDTSDVSVLYDMADKAVSMATSRQTEQVSFPAAASSSQVRPPPHLRHLLPFLQVSIALPQHLRNTQGTLFLPVVRTCIQCWCYLEWWVVQSVSIDGPEALGPGTSRPELLSVVSCIDAEMSIPWHPKLGSGIADGDGAVTSLTSDSTGYAISTPTNSASDEESMLTNTESSYSLHKRMQAQTLPETMS